MSLRDIEVAVEAFRKLTPEERVLFNVEAGRRGKRKGKKQAKRAPRSRHIKLADDAVPIKKALKAPAPAKKKVVKKKPVDPLSQEQVTQEQAG